MFLAGGSSSPSCPFDLVCGRAHHTPCCKGPSYPVFPCEPVERGVEEGHPSPQAHALHRQWRAAGRTETEGFLAKTKKFRPAEKEL